jgi:hypothetical protein
MTDSNASQPKPRATHLKWKQILAQLQADPTAWVQLVHQYSSDTSARVGVGRAAKAYGFKYYITSRKRQDDGRIGVFLSLEAEQ